MDKTHTDWRHRAACRDEDPELFFPISEVGPAARQATEAKAVCARCPVREQCLRYALDNGLDHGVFGGTTERERRAVTRRTRQAA
jgi:WhiB family redox-sensing transcriptional regulator